MIPKPKKGLSRNSLAENKAEINATKEHDNVSKEKNSNTSFYFSEKDKTKSQRKENNAEGLKPIKKVCKAPAFKTKESTGDHVFTSTPKIETKSTSAVMKAPKLKTKEQLQKVCSVRMLM
ncbi:hypothetical protein DPMN_062215 [Dreissena polymorpha]|uniref:Uncharacterized protein n=1 Tax=Dreissena polymorpha TaxID=45954 RepID=A0A9D4C9E2_DREPO|nr:hypothetical protein DPMN_062215 [Dreissena polymorpha]